MSELAELESADKERPSSRAIDKPLKVLGLTDYEEKAYLTLATLGVCRASELAKESKIPRQKIYEILENLSNKGFVNIIQDKVTLYSPISPMFVEKLLIDKFENARNFLTNLHEIGKNKHNDDIWIIRGKSKIDSIVYQFQKTLNVKKSFHVVGSNLLLISRLAKELAQLRKKSIDIKIIANNDSQTRKRANIFRKIDVKMKLIDPNFLKGVVAGVYDNEAAAIFDEEFMIFSNSKFVVNLVQNYFDLMWSSDRVK